MKLKKILTVGFSNETLNKVYWKKLENLAEQLIILPKDSPDFHKELSDTECLLTKFVPVTKADIEAAPNLKYIGALGTGYGSIDLEEAKKRGITVTNIPGYSTESVAEFVFAIILDLLRQLEKGKNQTREKNYSEDGFKAREIKGKVFGVLGLGRIGSRVAEIALGFGSDARYWSKNRKPGLEKTGVKYQEADSLIKEADFISLHFALTPETEKFLNQARINEIKTGAVVINTAPMELVDLTALENRLKKNDLTFIFDHSDEMKQEDLDRLSRFENCIIYPPIAYVSEEASKAKQEILIANIEGFLIGKPSNEVV